MSDRTLSSRQADASPEPLHTSPTDPSALPEMLSGHIPALDGVRGLAVLLVLFTDFTLDQHDTRLGSFFIKVIGSGWWGVNLFFVLSGFLITGILLREKSQPHYFRNFYMRRGLRIFPLYFAMLVAVFIVMPLLVTDDSPAQQQLVSRQWWLWTYLSNISIGINNDWWTFHGSRFGFGHVWSLAIEEHFYLVWPLVVLLCSPRRLVQVCVLFIIGAFATRAWFLLGMQKSVAAFVLTPCRLDGLALGSLLAVGLRHYPQSRQWVRAARTIAILCALGFLAMLLMRHRFSSKDPFIGTVGISILDWLSVSLVFLAATASPTDLVGRIFSVPLLRKFGKYSYSIYLLHPLLHGIYAFAFGVPMLTSWLGSPIAAMIVHGFLATCCAYGAALITWHLFEKHFLRLKSFFSASPAARPVPAADAVPETVQVARVPA